MHTFDKGSDFWLQIQRAFSGRLEHIAAAQVGLSPVLGRMGIVVPRVAERLASVQEGSGPPCQLRAGAPFAPIEALDLCVRQRGEGPAAVYLQTVKWLLAEHERLEFSLNLLRQIHLRLSGGRYPGAGDWKSSDNAVPIRGPDGAWTGRRDTVSATETPQLMEALHCRFQDAWEGRIADPILLIAAYTLDFFAIHPFMDGNGRVARLAMWLLLLKANHRVFAHFSLPGAMERQRRQYLDALVPSFQGWRSSSHDPTPWFSFVFDVVEEAYADVEYRLQRLESWLKEQLPQG